MDYSLPALPCYLNGEFGTVQDAKISVLDRGFIFGDGIYEVVPVYFGIAFRMKEHLARLNRSLNEVRIENPLTQEGYKTVIQTLLRNFDQTSPVNGAENNPNRLIYIQITRGVAVREHIMLKGLKPTIFVMCNVMPSPSKEQRENGVSCVSASDFRWEKAHIKSTSLLGSVFARQISADAGAVETIMFRGDYLSEAAASNVWIVKNGVVMGSPKNNLVLEGIRYNLIEDLCKANNIKFELRKIAKEEVFNADEIMLSSATKEVLPVTLLDGKSVGDGKPGAVYKTLYQAYQEALSRSKWD